MSAPNPAQEQTTDEMVGHKEPSNLEIANRILKSMPKRKPRKASDGRSKIAGVDDNDTGRHATCR